MMMRMMLTVNMVVMITIMMVDNGNFDGYDDFHDDDDNDDGYGDECDDNDSDDDYDCDDYL